MKTNKVEAASNQAEGAKCEDKQDGPHVEDADVTATPEVTRSAFAKAIQLGGRFVRWMCGYIIPLYLIVGVLCFIAIPKHVVDRIFDGVPAVSATAKATTPGGQGALSAASYSSKINVSAKPSEQAVERSGAPAIGTVNASSGELTSADIKTIEVVRIAVDSAKDRIEAMKDNYDKLFSLIAALAALLVFFGFKGLDTFNAAKTKASETVDQAVDAVKKAESARTLAEKSIKSLENFVDNRYTKDNGAEINVSQGIVLREMAELYRDMMLKSGKNEAEIKADYSLYLENSLSYLNRVTNYPENVDKKIVARALIIKGNVLKRLGRIDEAFTCASLAAEKYDSAMASFYNSACYCCLLAATNIAIPKLALDFEAKSIAYLRKAIEVDGNIIHQAVGDDDFRHFRENNNANFRSLTTP